MSKFLRVAMFFASDPSTAGGVQEHIINLSNELIKKGHTVDIYGPENNILDFPNYHPVSKIVVIPMPNGNWSNLTVKTSKGNELTDLINEKNYDLIHIHEPYTPFVNWEIMRNTKAPKVATFHTGWDDESINNFISPLLSLFQDTFSTYFKGGIFVSHLVKKRWQDLFGRNVQRIVLPNGVSPLFVPIEKKDNKFTEILFLGRLVPRKGPLYLLKALKKIISIEKNVHLTIVGMGPLKKSLESYVSLNQLEKYVTFFGEITGQKRLDFYQKADIFCAPYVDEAFGITIIEALASGTPVVVFKNLAFKEILKDYPEKKLLVKKKDSEQLAKALYLLIKDKDLRKKIVAWAKPELKKYDWIKLAEQTEEFYYKII